MKTMSVTKAREFDQITQILKGKPAASLALLPPVWQKLATSQCDTGLSDKMRLLYVEAARLFRFHDTSMCIEALDAIGKDFKKSSYPDFDKLSVLAQTPLERGTVAALKDIFSEFGYDMPSSFYIAILTTLTEGEGIVGLRLFKKKNALMRDRVWDAVLHGSLLVTPIGLYIQSIFSRYGVRFEHLMDCGCKTHLTSDASFTIALDRDFKPAYMQNMVAAAFEQYGVNAMTSGAKRGF